MASPTLDDRRIWDWALKASGLEPDAMVTRIVIDIAIDDVVKVYAQMYGNEELYVSPPEFPGSEVTIVTPRARRWWHVWRWGENSVLKGANHGDASLGT